MYESVCRLRVLDYQCYLPYIFFPCAMRQSIGGTYTLLLASGIEQRRELKHRFQGILTQRNYEIVQIHVAFKLLGLWKLLCSNGR